MWMIYLSNLKQNVTTQEKKLDHLEHLLHELHQAILQLKQYDAHFDSLKTQINTQYENYKKEQESITQAINALASKIDTLTLQSTKRTTVEKYRTKAAYIPKLAFKKPTTQNFTSMKQSLRHSLAINQRRKN